MGRSTTRHPVPKYYTACLTCNDRIEKRGKCKAGYDNWYFRRNKNNQCPKCQEERNLAWYR